LQSSELLDSEVVQVFDVCCTAHRAGFGAHEVTPVTEIVLPRRGVFLVERRGEVTAVDTNTVLVLGRDDAYRVSHPVEGGDDSTVFIYPSELLLTALGGDGSRQGTVWPALQLMLFRIRRALTDELVTRLDREERCMSLLRALVEILPVRHQHERSLGPGQRLRVHRARALLASEPTRSWDLAAVARAVDSSPFHLARQFRCGTGETIARYLLRLRLGIAIHRLAEGEDDLMRLACDLGFAHHSHFSARFRAVFGLTPSEVRRSLTGRDVREQAVSRLGLVAGESPG
jgi:AraC family transcriptional regulator